MPFEFALLRDSLVCPKSRSKLVQHGDALVCVDPDCRLSYAVRDDIPILLIDEAAELPPDDWQAVMRDHPTE